MEGALNPSVKQTLFLNFFKICVLCFSFISETNLMCEETGVAMQVERSLRYLWDAGDERATLAWLRADSIPTIIARDVQRSIWADIEHVPEALAVLEAAWPREAVIPELSLECVRAAATALRVAGHEQAEAVAALLEHQCGRCCQ